MTETSPRNPAAGITLKDHAPQHGPRPLPLFLSHLWQETENNHDLRQKALLGLRKYQDAIRPDISRIHDLTAQCGPAQLLRIISAENDGNTRGNDDRPIIILIPSLINSHLILDLSDTQSFAQHLIRAGFAPYLVNWGNAGKEDAALNLNSHITERLIPLILSLDRPVHLLGYCLGGTLAMGAGVALKQAGADILSLTTIAAPWHFDAYSDEDHSQISTIWEQSAPLCERLGLVPMEVLQNGFWALDPQRTIAKYAAFADMPDGTAQQQAFLAVEDWANEGAPLTFAAGQQLFGDFYGANITGRNEWAINGQIIKPDSLPCPSLCIRSTTDRIVPSAAAPRADSVIDSDLGHVGMIISRHAPQKIWEPLSRWLSNPMSR